MFLLFSRNFLKRFPVALQYIFQYFLTQNIDFSNAINSQVHILMLKNIFNKQKFKINTIKIYLIMLFSHV